MVKMKINVYNLKGKPKKNVTLPDVFGEEYRPDVIKRAVLSIQTNRRQPYGANEMAGKRTSAHYHGRRGRIDTMMNRELSRMPRIHGSNPMQNLRGAFAPQAVGGRKAHPPKPEKVWSRKINKKERRLAIRSAIAASAIKDLILDRGHKVENIKTFPIIVENGLEELKKTRDVVAVLRSLGLTDELKRCSEKKIRSGKGKMRGRKYKKKKGPLIIIAEDKGIVKAAENIGGVDVSVVQNLNVELLAPGTHAGRLTVWSESAIDKLNKEKLFW